MFFDKGGGRGGRKRACFESLLMPAEPIALAARRAHMLASLPQYSLRYSVPRNSLSPVSARRIATRARQRVRWARRAQA